MKTGIELFIRDSFNQEVSDVLLESLEVLNQAEIENPLDDLYELLMEEGNLERADLTTQFQSIIAGKLLAMIHEHGIKLADETTIYTLNQICFGLMDVEFYLDGTTILRSCESDLDTEEKLAQILGLVTGLDEHTLIASLEEVNPSLIDRIEELFYEMAVQPQEERESNELEHKIVKRLRSIVRCFQVGDPFIGTRLLNAGVLVAAPFSEYLKYFTQQLDDMVLEAAAKELFMMLNISSDGYNATLQTYTAHADVIFHDIDKVAKMTSLLSKLQLEFDRYELQRSAAVTPETQGLLK